MTIQIKHAKVSAKGDGGDATLIRPTDWNAVHTTTMASGNLLGRSTVGPGSFEEIPISPYMMAALAATDAEALLAALGIGAFKTGDVNFTFADAAPAGWVLMVGGTGTPPTTIGNGASGAVLRANADCLALFTVVYDTCADAEAPVSGGRTGNAVNDFNAGKTIRIPNIVGRSIIGAGGAADAPPSGGAATTAKIIGRGYGAETTTLVAANIPPITSSGTNTISLTGPSSGGLMSRSISGGGTSENYQSGVQNFNNTNAVNFAGNVNITVVSTGTTSTSFDRTHSTIALNVMVKL
jgi:hypothetical protein